MIKNILHKLPKQIPAVFALGFVSQITQVLFLREFLIVFLGSELSIGLIFAAWLAWIGIGSQIGVHLNHHVRNPISLLFYTATGLAISIPITIILIRSLNSFFDLLPGSYLSFHDMMLACFILMAPTCLLLGIQFVTLSKIWREKDQEHDTSGATKTYIGEASSNIIGGLVFTFLMVRNLNALQSAAIMSLIIISACSGIIWKHENRRSLRQWGLVALSVIILVSFIFINVINQWSQHLQWQHFSPDYHLINTYQSKHGTISVFERDGQFHFFQSGHLVFSIAGPATAYPWLENQDAIVFSHLAMTQHQEPVEILLVGGGLRGVLNEIIHHPIEKIDYVELDERLTAAAKPYLLPETLQALNDDRVNLIHSDGRLFIKTTPTKYDLIIIDMPDPATAVLNRYYTREFFLEAKGLLNSDGVFVISAMSTPDLRGLSIVNRNTTVYHTLSSVFPHVITVGEQYLTFFASKTDEHLTIHPVILEDRFIERNIHTSGFSPDYFYPLLYEPYLHRIRWILEYHGREPFSQLTGPGSVPIDPEVLALRDPLRLHQQPVNQRYFINTDLKPIAYFYTLMFLNELTLGSTSGFLENLLSIQPWLSLVFVGVPFLITALLMAVSKYSEKISSIYFPLLFSVFATGFSSMTLQITLIFSFQSIYGFIYETIGVIIALFMLGLAIGAYFAYRFINHKAKTPHLMSVQITMAVFSLLIAACLLGTTRISSPVFIFIIYSVLTMTAGLINGLSFPLASACFLKLTYRAEKSSGIVYSTEVFGACIGAILASVLIAPIFGIVACCLLAGMINTTAFGLFILAK